MREELKPLSINLQDKFVSEDSLDMKLDKLKDEHSIYDNVAAMDEQSVCDGVTTMKESMQEIKDSLNMKLDKVECNPEEVCECEPPPSTPDFITINVPTLLTFPLTTLDADHDWGYQVRMVNEPEYCAKLLVLENDTPGSLHYHEKKKETFIILMGEVAVSTPHYFPERGLSTIFYKTGAIITLEPGTKHEMKNTGGSVAVILEVSTHDDDEDYVEA